MKAMIKMLMFAAFAVTGSQVFADDLMSCKDAKKMNEPAVIEYVIKGTNSQRLGSDVLYRDTAGNPSILSSLQVAQYAHSKLATYILFDDSLERPILSFEALLPARNRTFLGAIQEINEETGKVRNSRALKCTLTDI